MTITSKGTAAAAGRRVAETDGRSRRRRPKSVLGVLAVAVAATAVWVTPAVGTDGGWSNSQAMEAWAARLDGAADAHFEHEANVRRRLDAWSARLEGAAAAYFRSDGCRTP